MLTKKQVMALTDAHACAGHRGLERAGGRWYPSHNARVRTGHANVTVTSLVDKGLLRLWANGQVAHATDLGAGALEDWREDAARR